MTLNWIATLNIFMEVFVILKTSRDQGQSSHEQKSIRRFKNVVIFLKKSFGTSPNREKFNINNSKYAAENILGLIVSTCLQHNVCCTNAAVVYKTKMTSYNL